MAEAENYNRYSVLEKVMEIIQQSRKMLTQERIFKSSAKCHLKITMNNTACRRRPGELIIFKLLKHFEI